MRPRGFWQDANALCYGDGEDVLAAGARLSLADAASYKRISATETCMLITR